MLAWVCGGCWLRVCGDWLRVFLNAPWRGCERGACVLDIRAIFLRVRMRGGVVARVGVRWLLAARVRGLVACFSECAVACL